MHKHTIQKSRLHRSNLDGFFSPSHYLSWAYVSCNNSWNWVRFFSRLFTSVEQSPTKSALRCCTTRPLRLHGERDLSRSLYMTQVLHTARISKGRNIASFELGKEMEKDGLFFFVPTRDKTKKNHLSLFLYRAQNQQSFLFYLQK